MSPRVRTLSALAAAALTLALGEPASAAHAHARATGARAADAQTINVLVTSYGYNDNDDGNGHYGTAQIAYPQIHDVTTEDLGTYDQPVTFATDAGKFAPGTIIYVAHLEKYFIMEDGCVECSADWSNGNHHVDLWMEPNDALQPEPALDDCEGSITGDFDIVVNPDPGLPVDTNPMFSGGQCTVDTY